MAIVRNRLADSARKDVRRKSNEVLVDEIPETFSDVATNNTETYRDPDALKRSVRRLPKGQREAVEMVKLREMTFKEASAATGTSVNALKVAVHRGVARLRVVLRAKGKS